MSEYLETNLLLLDPVQMVLRYRTANSWMDLNDRIPKNKHLQQRRN